MSPSQSRRPAGTPTGGQFAPSTHPRPGFELAAEPEAGSEPEAKPSKPLSPSEQAAQRYREARKEKQPRERLVELAYEWGWLWGLSHRRQVRGAGATPADVAQQTACQAAEGRLANPGAALREHAAGVLEPGDSREEGGDWAERLAGQLATLGAEGLRPEVAIAAWRQRYDGGYRGVSDEALIIAWQRAQPAPAWPDPDRGLVASGDAFAEVDERLWVAAAVARVRAALLAEQAAAARARDAAERAGRSAVAKRAADAAKRAEGMVWLLEQAELVRQGRERLSNREVAKRLGTTHPTVRAWREELAGRFAAALAS